METNRHMAILSANVFADQMAKLDEYQKATRSATRSEAVRRLFDEAFQSTSVFNAPTPAPAPEPCQ